MRRTGAKQTSSTTLQYKRRPARPSESPQAGVASQRSPESLWTGPPRSVIGWEQPPGKSSLGTNTGEIQKAAGGSWSTPLPAAGGAGGQTITATPGMVCAALAVPDENGSARLLPRAQGDQRSVRALQQLG